MLAGFSVAGAIEVGRLSNLLVEVEEKENDGFVVISV